MQKSKAIAQQFKNTLEYFNKQFPKSQSNFQSEKEKVYYLISKEWIEQWKSFIQNQGLQKNQISPINANIVENGKFISIVKQQDVIKVNETIFNKCFSSFEGYPLRRVAFYRTKQKQDKQKIVNLEGCQIKILLISSEIIDKITKKQIQIQNFKLQLITSLNFNHTFLDLEQEINYKFKLDKKNQFIKIWLCNKKLNDAFNHIYKQCETSKIHHELKCMGKQINYKNLQQKEQSDIKLSNIDLGSESYFVIEAAKDKKWFFKSPGEQQCDSCFLISKIQIKCPYCQKARYCSKNCQINDEPYHKLYCTFWAKNSIVQMVKLPNCKLGLVGIRNLGNTCFMSCILQCLSHTQELRKYFLENQYLKDLNIIQQKQNKDCCAIIQSFAEFLCNAWYKQNPIVNPFPIKQAISKIYPQYSGGIQHDTHQFFNFLINTMNFGLNRLGKPIKQGQNSTTPKVEKYDIENLALKNWFSVCKIQQSIFTQTMKGQMISRLICKKCTYQSFNVQNFIALTLPIPESIIYKQMNLIVLQKNLLKKPYLYCLVYKQEDISKWIKSAAIALKKRPSLCKVYFLTFDDEIHDLSTMDKHDALYKINNQQDKIFLIQLTPLDLQMSQRVQLTVRFLKSSQKNKSLWYKYPLFFQRQKADGISIYKRILKFLYPSVYRWSIYNAACKYMNKSLSYEEYEKQMLNVRPFELVLYVNKKEDCKIPDQSYLRDLLYQKNPKKCQINVIFNQKLQQNFSFNIKNPDSTARNYKSQQFSKIEVSLEKCFETFQEPQYMSQENGWICSSCKQTSPAVKILQLYKTPKILIIHLKRFRQRQKFSCNVLFPLQLDLNDFVIDKNPMTSYIPIFLKKGILKKKKGQSHKETDIDVNSKPLYQLYGVCNHYGELGGGHYTAFAKNKDVWYQFNDSKVTQIHSSKVQSPAAYMLFYQRIKEQQN